MPDADSLTAKRLVDVAEHILPPGDHFGEREWCVLTHGSGCAYPKIGRA
jgi:hypothetical protein